jgi:hypothetical protein
MVSGITLAKKNVIKKLFGPLPNEKSNPCVEGFVGFQTIKEERIPIMRGQSWVRLFPTRAESHSSPWGVGRN